MTETERNQIKDALFKCAEENENKFTLTGHIVVSSLCKSAVERIEELEKENEGLKAFENHCDEIEEDAKAIAKENAELKKKLDKIRNYLVYDIFDRFKYLENLLKISQEKQEELSKCIIEQQKTTGSLTDLIYELKAQIGKMKNVGNCKHAMDCAKFNEKELIYGKIITCKNCKDWGLAE